MKKFELKGMLGSFELYKAVFELTEEEEKALLDKVKDLSEKGKHEGEDTAVVDNQMNADSDVVIRSVLQALGKNGIATFETGMRKQRGAGTATSIHSLLVEIQWECKRIGHFEVVK